jgi:hypothetical protein
MRGQTVMETEQLSVLERMILGLGRGRGRGCL